ncbi:replication initiation protein [Halobacillus locisalis]|uniref:Replication initiation protein n=1 Tax=Halobacillus locisalis TaxID=220753 RepID=A0A838CXV4_9BACI|nr:replication initiation protein [Halobacillus locisalis]MBA2176867.1 replication initiation protein [Halobacillus locisalis]
MLKDISSNERNWVTKSNELIEATYRSPLTKREQKLIAYVVSQIEPRDEEFHIYRVSIREFTKMMGLEQPKYTELGDILKKLMSKVIEIEKTDGKKLLTHWISGAEYSPDEGPQEGTIDFSFDPRLKPYLLQLKNQFTSYRLENILELKSGYSIRFYELLKKWENVGVVTFTVDELRRKVGAVEVYKEFANFRQRVLEPASKELREKTDIYFEYEPIKKGRKYHSITFSIQLNKIKVEPIPIEEDSNYEDIVDNFMITANKLYLKVNKSTMKNWLAQSYAIWGDSYQESLHNLMEEAANTKSLKNPPGFVVWKINEFAKELDDGKIAEPYEWETGEVIPDWFKQKEEQKTGENEAAASTHESIDTNELAEQLKRLTGKSMKHDKNS